MSLMSSMMYLCYSLCWGLKMMGINVRNTDIPFADLIVDGIKTIETRDTPSLSPYIGQRVAIVRTGAGKALAIGEVTIVGHSFANSEEVFDKLVDQHHVTKGDLFYIKDKGKHLYHLTDSVRYTEPKPVAHGIVARKVLPFS